eukprot:s729_g9.t1
MDTMTEHWGHLIGRTLEPPPSEEAHGEPPAAPDAAPVADGVSTSGEGDRNPSVNPDVVDTMPFDPYLATEDLPDSPPPASPPKEVDALLTLPTLVLGETVDDVDDPKSTDPKDSQVEPLPAVPEPQLCVAAPEASVPEVPAGQPDVCPAEPPARLDGTAKTEDGFNALDHQDGAVGQSLNNVLYKVKIHEDAVSRLEQFRRVPRDEEDPPAEETKPSGRAKAKAKAKGKGMAGKPKAKAKARGRPKAKAKATAKSKAQKKGPTGSQVTKTTRKRKTKEPQEPQEQKEEILVTPPKRRVATKNAEHGSKTKRKRASRGEATSFARRNPPEGERGFAEWKAIREAYRVNLAHLKPQSIHEDATAKSVKGFSSLYFLYLEDTGFA